MLTISDAWNRVSASYQERHDIPTHSAHYGPWSPLESELNLLGDVRGLHIVEVGCGGGQCAIAFAKQGAQVVGIDPSDEQLAFANHLAADERVKVRFMRGSAEALDSVESGTCDIVFSAYAFQYVADLPRALGECARVLRPGGRLALSLDHPFRDCFFDQAEQENVLYPARSYFDRSPMRWPFDGVTMTSHHHTIADWLAMLSNAGFTLHRLLEPAPPADLADEIWQDEDNPLYTQRHIPQTIIFLAQKQA